MSTENPPESTSCPRCGYDLSGQMVQWKAARPAETRCAECGLEDVMRLVESPMFRVPAWSYEHAAHHRVRAFRRTMMRTLRPWRFWREMPLESPIMTARLVRFLLLSIVAAVLVCAAMTTIEVAGNLILERRAWKPPPPALAVLRPILPPSFTAIAVSRRLWPELLNPSFVRTLLWTLLFPLTLLLLPQTMRACRIRKLQMLRVAAYSLWPPVALCGLSFWWSISSGTYGTVRPFFWVDCRDPWPVTVLVALWLWIYWAKALGRYLGLPKSGKIVALNGLAAFLAATALVFWFGELAGGEWTNVWISTWM